MATHAHLWQPFLDQAGVVILDGGLATELERRGADLSGPLWSAKLLRSSAGWLIFCSNVFCFANNKRGMSRRNQKAPRALTVEDIVYGLTTI